MVVALTCPRCGAPLPEVAVKAAPAQALVTCAYCGTSCRLGAGSPTVQQAGTAVPTRDFAEAAFFQQVVAVFHDGIRRGQPAYEALIAAAREKLGPMGERDTFARVCIALARDFDAEHGTDTVHDAMCMARMINVYLLAIASLRTMDSYTADMPFFTSTPKGPVHFQRTLTAERIAELASRDPSTKAAATPKKKRFWPLG
jgi:hypothetical protein